MLVIPFVINVCKLGNHVYNNLFIYCRNDLFILGGIKVIFPQKFPTLYFVTSIIKTTPISTLIRTVI